MLECKEVPRYRVTSVEEIRRLFAKQEPFITEEQDNPDFQEFAKICTAEHIRELWANRDWRVQDFEQTVFDPFVPPVENTAVMPFDTFLERFENPIPGRQNYVNIWPTEGTPFAMDFFAKMREFGKKLPLTQPDGQDLKTLWLGGKGTITPLHYDTYARSHGTVRGEKLYIFFPPDRHHLKKLEAYPVRTTQGWWSRIGFGPLDPELFPQLEGTKPWRALCKPGDFVWLPPCWWHHVSIPESPTITISATHHDPHSKRYYYHWRMRTTRWLGRRQGVLRKVLATH